MAKAEQEQQTSHRRQNRFLLMLLVGAALVSATKDLGRLHDFTSSVAGLAASLHERVNTAVKSPAEPVETQALAEKDRSGQPYNWNGRVAPDQLLEMKSNGGIDAVPAVGGEPLLIAVKTGSCREPLATPIEPTEVARHATSVASAAPHTREFSSRRRIVEIGRNRQANQSATIRVRNNDVRLNFIVRMPAGLHFISRMIDDDITVTAVEGNTSSIKLCPLATLRLDSHPAIGRFDFFTGYAQARIRTEIADREVKAKLPPPNCAEAVAFKTADGPDGLISLDLLKLLRALATETPNDGKVSDFPRTLKGFILRTVPAPAEDAH
jgi:hypothetical protein